MPSEAYTATGFGLVEAAADELEGKLLSMLSALHMNAPTTEELAIYKREVDTAFDQYGKALTDYDEQEQDAVVTLAEEFAWEDEQERRRDRAEHEADQREARM
jgi:hypothetical protein